MTDQAFRPPGERPADRYGDRPANPRRTLLLAVILGALALLTAGWWVWVAVDAASPGVRHELLGFDAISATSVEIRLSVVREPGVTVACVLRARGASGEEVGRLQVVVPPATTDRSDLTATVRTTRPAVTGEVLACQLYDPPAGLADGVATTAARERR